MRVFIMTALLFLTACGNPFGDKSNVDANHHPGGGDNVNVGGDKTLLPAPDAGFINSASQHVTTTSRGYKVSYSVGALTNSVQTETSRGYKVYTNVHGTLLSEEQ